MLSKTMVSRSRAAVGQAAQKTDRLRLGRRTLDFDSGQLVREAPEG